MVCKLKKDLYGLKQAPRTHYARLNKNLEKNGFAKGMVDSNLYLKAIWNGFLIILIFVDGIIFERNDEKGEEQDEKIEIIYLIIKVVYCLSFLFHSWLHMGMSRTFSSCVSNSSCSCRELVCDLWI